MFQFPFSYLLVPLFPAVASDRSMFSLRYMIWCHIVTISAVIIPHDVPSANFEALTKSLSIKGALIFPLNVIQIIKTLDDMDCFLKSAT